jgi:hypothetical protein
MQAFAPDPKFKVISMNPKEGDVKGYSTTYSCKNPDCLEENTRYWYVEIPGSRPEPLEEASFGCEHCGQEVVVFPPDSKSRRISVHPKESKTSGIPAAYQCPNTDCGELLERYWYPGENQTSAFAGYCDECKAWSDDLKSHDGTFLCADCALRLSASPKAVRVGKKMNNLRKHDDRACTCGCVLPMGCERCPNCGARVLHAKSLRKSGKMTI